MAFSDVILRIKSQGDLASLQAGIQMLSQLARKIIEITSDLDKFSVMMKRVDMEMVNYADSAVKGQISTKELMSQFSKLNAADLPVTKDQFKTMAVAATNLAKATGQDATDAFKRLSESITKGSTEALREYGIILTSTSDIHKAQQEALSQLNDKYGESTVELETMSERLYQLKNNLGTAASEIYSVTGTLINLSGVLDSANAGLSEFNQFLSESPDAARNFIFSTRGVIGILREFALSFLTTVSDILNSMGLNTPYGLKVAKYINQRAAGIQAEEFGAAAANEKESRGMANAFDSAVAANFRPKVGGGGAGGYDPGISIGYDPGEILQASRLAQSVGSSIDTVEDFEYWMAMLEASKNFETPDFSVDDLLSRKTPEWKKESMDDIFGPDEVPRSEKIAKIREELTKTYEDQSLYKEAMLEHLNSEIGRQERLAQLEEEDAIRRAENVIYVDFQRRRALDFAQEFKDAWTDSLKSVSAGAYTATTVMGGLRDIWAHVITNAIEGAGSVKEGILQITKQVGIALAIEGGLNVIKETARGFSLLAQRQYDAASQAFTSAGIWGALAVAGGAAAAGANAGLKNMNSGRGQGGSAVGAYGGSQYPSYQQPSNNNQQVEIIIYMDEKQGELGFHAMMVRADDKAWLSGDESIRGKRVA
jgi:hypothetical protein